MLAYRPLPTGVAPQARSNVAIVAAPIVAAQRLALSTICVGDESRRRDRTDIDGVTSAQRESAAEHAARRAASAARFVAAVYFKDLPMSRAPRNDRAQRTRGPREPRLSIQERPPAKTKAASRRADAATGTSGET
jgi:hypothetical protein